MSAPNPCDYCGRDTTLTGLCRRCANLRRPVASQVPVLASPQARSEAIDLALDQTGARLAAMLSEARMGTWKLSRALGRDMSRTVPQIKANGEAKVSTLAELAAVCGYRVEISFVRDVTHAKRDATT